VCGIAVGVAVIVMTPWVVRNLVTFDEPATLSTGDGAVLLGADCDRTYSGRFLGVWSLECSTEVEVPDDAAVESRLQREKALDYIGDNLGRLPVVAAARVGRAFDVFRPFETADFGTNEGRPKAMGVAGVLTFWVLAPFAIAGLVISRRRLFVVWPLLVPFGIVVAVVLFGYGIPRFRVPAEPSIVVLGAVGVVAAWTRLTGGTRAASGDADQPSSTIEASSSS